MFVRTFVVIWVVLMFDGWPVVSTSKMNSESETTWFCHTMEYFFHTNCWEYPAPSKVCKNLGALLKNICDYNPPCLSTTKYSVCLYPETCANNTLSFGQCPNFLVCCASFPFHARTPEAGMANDK
ncbi:uncharacterized protein LOC143285003 [Babylonia areolata]|uniref:uncharacterized protein LOC143285003 n=1 Tax=Babylonia areolata TaxID=304850 RepID=UPI003FD4BD98